MSGKITATILASFFLANFTLAQTGPEIWATWRADSFVPPFYQGKQLPTRNTNVEVRFELVDGSRAANLSQTEIRWYLNEKLAQKGNGLKTFSYQVGRNSTRDLIRINIPNYAGGELNQFLDLPIRAPEVVLTGIFPTFLASPYFFNIKNINEVSFEWLIGGISSKNTGEGYIIVVDDSNLPTGSTWNGAVTVNAKSRLSILEQASALLNFSYIK